MKKVALFLFAAMPVFCGCEKENDNENKFALEIISEEHNIDEIRFTGYLSDGTRTLIGKGGPSGNGYTVYIDDPLAPMYLYNITRVPDYGEKFYFSDPTVMCYNGSHFFHAYKNNALVGTFERTRYIQHDPEAEIDYENHWVKFIYVTGDVDITGTMDTEWGDPYQTYDLRLSKGWNIYVQIDYHHTSHTGYTQSLFTSDIPNGIEWKLKP